MAYLLVALADDTKKEELIQFMEDNGFDMSFIKITTDAQRIKQLVSGND